MKVHTKSGARVELTGDLILNSIGVEEPEKIKKWKFELEQDNFRIIREKELVKQKVPTQEENEKVYNEELKEGKDERQAKVMEKDMKVLTGGEKIIDKEQILEAQGKKKTSIFSFRSKK